MDIIAKKRAPMLQYLEIEASIYNAVLIGNIINEVNRRKSPHSNVMVGCRDSPLNGIAENYNQFPVIMGQEVPRLMPQLSGEDRTRQIDMEAAAIIGFTSAIAAYGAFFIPKAYGTSIANTGGPEAALWAFMAFYLTCVGVTWFYYTRRGGLLYDVERQGKNESDNVSGSGN